jgi:hypothetical protein
MSRINHEMLRELAQIYNQNGKHHVYELLRNQYDIKNPYLIFQRMKNREELEYMPEEDKFKIPSGPFDSDNVFMSMEELCTPAVTQSQHQATIKMDSRPEAMEKLIQELIGDRLLEIRRYVTLDSLSKTLIIDKTSLVSDGYQVVTH